MKKEGHGHGPAEALFWTVPARSVSQLTSSSARFLIPRQARRDKQQRQAARQAARPRPDHDPTYVLPTSLLSPTNTHQQHNDWQRWWRSPGSVAPNQLPLPAPAAAHDGPDLALRAAVDPHHWHHPGKRPDCRLDATALTEYLGVRRVHEPGCEWRVSRSEARTRLTRLRRSTTRSRSSRSPRRTTPRQGGRWGYVSTGAALGAAQLLTGGVANPAQGRQRVSHPERVRVREARHRRHTDTTKWDTRESGKYRRTAKPVWDQSVLLLAGGASGPLISPFPRMRPSSG